MLTPQELKNELAATVKQHGECQALQTALDDILAERNRKIRLLVNEGFTQTAIGEALGVGRERISQIVQPPRVRKAKAKKARRRVRQIAA